jgi:hypothetical protein
VTNPGTLLGTRSIIAISFFFRKDPWACIIAISLKTRQIINCTLKKENKNPGKEKRTKKPKMHKTHE